MPGVHRPGQIARALHGDSPSKHTLPDGTRADYVLCDRAGRPMAALEAKHAGIDPISAQDQARHYAAQPDVPFAFLSNGEEVWFLDRDTDAHARQIAGFYSQDDLERRTAARGVRRDLATVPIDRRIVDRDYQIDCIDALSAEIERGRRNLLVEMATGTGKTRTAAAFVKRLFEAGVVTRVLFLVDRIALAGRARDAKTVPTSLVLGTERRPYLTFDYLACRLAETPYERWRDSRNVAALVNLPNMRVPAEARVDAYAAAVRGLLAVEPDTDKRAKYLEYVDIYAGLNKEEHRRYEREHPQENTTMAGIIQRARDEGRHQGRRQGRVEGGRAVLERQLRRRFGLLPPGIVERLEQASAHDLETWADNVLDAGTLDGVFGREV